jgi:hypothetical protein
VSAFKERCYCPAFGVQKPLDASVAHTQIPSNQTDEDLDGPAVSALGVQSCWSVRWVTKYLLSRVPPCFGRHVKPLVPAAFVVVSTHQSATGPRGGLWPILLMCNSLGRPLLQQWGH